MNTSFFNSMKIIFFYSGIKPFRKEKIMNPKITGLIIIVFASVLFVGCNNDNNGGAKKADPATQTNEKRDDDKHEGMDHDAPGMDTMHRKKNN